MEIKEGRTIISVPHLEDKVSFVYPAFNGTYGKIGSSCPQTPRSPHTLPRTIRPSLQKPSQNSSGKTQSATRTWNGKRSRGKEGKIRFQFQNLLGKALKQSLYPPNQLQLPQWMWQQFGSPTRSIRNLINWSTWLSVDITGVRTEFSIETNTGIWLRCRHAGRARKVRILSYL